jgi:hypothetical protein
MCGRDDETVSGAHELLFQEYRQTSVTRSIAASVSSALQAIAAAFPACQASSISLA